MTINVFFGCYIRRLHLVERHAERITKVDQNMINDLDYEGMKFPVAKKIIVELKDKTIFPLKYSVMKII